MTMLLPVAEAELVNQSSGDRQVVNRHDRHQDAAARSAMEGHIVGTVDIMNTEALAASARPLS